MKEYDKRKSHLSSKLLMIHISSNNARHPVTNIFTALTTLRPTNYTSLHFTTISTLHFLPFKLQPIAVTIIICTHYTLRC